MNEQTSQSFRLKRWAKWLLGFAILFVGIAFLAPYLFTRPALKPRLDFTSEQTNIADTVGGLMNPFIALAGVIVTGLAFYMQYMANRMLESQLRTQDNQYSVEQFEAHFFEMLRLHKENVNEMEFLDETHHYKGRSVFKRAMEQIHTILANTQPSYQFISGAEMPDGDEVFPFQFDNAYTLFFWGLDAGRSYRIRNTMVSFSVTTVLYSAIQEPQNWNAILGHYYRHLYHMVKYVVQSKAVPDYEDKMRYLTILRAQLSNYEQIMLFYNWLAGYGTNWEKEGNTDDDNLYFTKYRMIHNVWRQEVYQRRYTLSRLAALDEKSRRLIGKPLLEDDE